MAIRIDLPCGIPIEERPVRHIGYMLTCTVCGRKVDCSEHREYLDKVARQARRAIKDLPYCCIECKTDSDATLVNPMSFGKA